MRKLLDDLSYFVPAGHWLSALISAADTLLVDPVPESTRSLLAGSDTAPKESVPFGPGDFDSEHQRALIIDPWRVTDERGAALPSWLDTQPVFEKPVRAGRVPVSTRP
jgi:hypothetical protein